MTITMKQKLTPKFYPDEVVYAIAFYTPEPADAWSTNFLKIFKVIINSTYVHKTGIEYTVEGVEDKEEWGAPVGQEFVFATKEEALTKITKLWKL